jgi:anthranilate/para-aminobenzoate synthase component I
VLVAREVPIRPDPLEVARSLTARGLAIALLQAAERRGGPFERWSFVAVFPDRESHALDPMADDDEPPVRAGAFAHVPRWVGLIPYEARRDALERRAWVPVETRPAPALVRPVWRRHRAVACFDHASGRVFAVARVGAEADELAALLRRPSPAAPRPDVVAWVAASEPPERHLERIAAAKDLIRRGDLYQVNLARPLRVRLARTDPALALAARLALYERMVRAAPTPFAVFLPLGEGVAVLSTTPELLLLASASGIRETSTMPRAFGQLLTIPIKGTRPRGPDAPSDRGLAQSLDEDPKEHAELTMIVDVERNDLGAVAAVGSVRFGAPRVVTHRTVHHREAVVRAVARPGLSREAVLAAMVPSGSVTGAPKVRAMEVIATLEGTRRGLYTGAIGHVAHDGSATLAMAIRTLVVAGDEGEYLSGGGIVADSDPARELEETGWKALQLERSLASAGTAG